MGKTRIYHRDSRGRFATTGTATTGKAGGGGGGGGRKGTAGAYASRNRSREKLASNPSSAQKGAVTRAQNRLSAAKKDNTVKLSSSLGGVYRKGRGKASGSKASGATTGGAGNQISPFPRAKPQNGIRPAPKLPGRAGRALDSIGRNIDAMSGHVERGRKLMDKMDRGLARDLLGKSPLNREIARQSGGVPRARDVVRRRQQRAFDVRDRGNEKIGSKAIMHYQQQLRELGSAKSEKVPFRRKPMTQKEAERAAAKRNAEQMKRMEKALKEDLKMDRISYSPPSKQKRSSRRRKG